MRLTDRSGGVGMSLDERMLVHVPAPHAAFLRSALARLSEDERVVGVAAGGSFVTGSMDEYSDLDLVVVVEPAAYDAVMEERLAIAGRLGPLLAGFTGEHVGEPRLLICLYGPPVLHVDLKFVRPEDLAVRVEEPIVLWERDGRVAQALAAGEARYPMPDPQWIEDRFWVWVHYVAAKIARGELLEACDGLGLLRSKVLGPLGLFERGHQPAGVRKIERVAPQLAEELRRTVTLHDAASCVAALEAAVATYRALRARSPLRELVARGEAERTAVGYLEEMKRSLVAAPSALEAAAVASPESAAVPPARLLDALAFAAAKHRDQRRKDEGASPYINHPIEVVNVLATEGGVRDEPVLLAAVLHDTIEDTETSYEELAERFGTAVAGIVRELSDDKSLPKEERKRLQVERAPRASSRAKLVKIADKICNVRDIAQHPPAGWPIERRLEYLDWSERVIAGCRGLNSRLDVAFDDAVFQARRSMASVDAETEGATK